MLSERYRIVGLLGRGGMGEVYRADDLILRQPVALKLLPEALADSPQRLERLCNEVRIARQVSHPNVCRVYDIGQIQGQHFLSMEYVDGEDLASLLRRIGRLPKDKGIQIARQLCAGLAAAHDRGVLHRDLKPHNVMLDGHGQVRITDFGLAGFATDFSRGGKDIGAGTPAYMAPEQLEGREVTVRSDIYSLGLVLYHVFTGQPALKANTRHELLRLHKKGPIVRPSSLVDDINPAVERIILQCLAGDPRHRPSSAMAVAACMPGGDPLAALLAAGETPSPEMVAAAAAPGRTAPSVVLAYLIATLLGLAVIARLADQVSLFGRVPIEQPPDVLVSRAQDILTGLSCIEPPTDTAHGFAIDLDYLRYIDHADLSPTRWGILANEAPPAVYFWFRQSPNHLKGDNPLGTVSQDDPPSWMPNMANVRLDPHGRLIALEVGPLRMDAIPERLQRPSWSDLFVAAGLKLARFTQIDPTRTPPVYCDETIAWEGSDPDRGDLPIHIEAGAYYGRPVYFEVLWPRAVRSEAGVYETILLALTILVLGVSVVFARRNLRLGRGDRRGARKLVIYYQASFMFVWAIQANHVLPLVEEWKLFVRAVGYVLFWSGYLWLVYIALEPSVRRRWPHRIVTWNRLLAGGFRDPLVGRDFLIGALFGVALLLLDQLGNLVPLWLALPPPIPYQGSPNTLLGARHVLTESLLIQLGCVLNAMGLLFLLLLLRVVLRREWLATGVCFLILTMMFYVFSAGGQSFYIASLLSGLEVAMLMLVLIRIGLLALMVTLFVSSMLSAYPVTWNFAAWQSGSSSFAMLTCAALAVYGFYSSLAGQSLFKDDLLERS